MLLMLQQRVHILVDGTGHCLLLFLSLRCCSYLIFYYVIP